MLSQYQYIIFHKPYGVLSQFTNKNEKLHSHNKETRTLSDFKLPKGVYPAGRLDKDSEGLLLLTNDGVFNQKVTNPQSKKEKTYWVQVEKRPSEENLKKLSAGLQIKDYITRPCRVKAIFPDIDARVPPIRERKTVPTQWLELTISEGKNRQVRRMTAKIGHPCLRLIRVGIGKYFNSKLGPGDWISVKKRDIL